MTVPSVIAVLALLLPVFIGTWPVSVFALSVQAACGAWIGLHHEFNYSHAGSWIAVVDAGLRIILGPAILLLLSASRPQRSHFELLPVNIGYWFATGGIVFAAFTLGGQIQAIDAQAPAAVVTATAASVMFAFLVLSVKQQIASQAIAILMLENGVFFFENSLEHHLPAPVQIGLSVVYGATMICFRYALVFQAAEVIPTKEPASW